MGTSISDEEVVEIFFKLINHDQNQSQKQNPDQEHEVRLQATEGYQIQSKKRKTDKTQNSQLEIQPMKKKPVDEDDSVETLIKLLEWKKIKPGFVEMFKDVAERFSEPVRKQLRESDIKNDQSRLMLGKIQVKTRMLPLLKDSEIRRLSRGTEGLDISVYGQDGEVQEMKFKMWNVNTPVLTSGWKEFVAKYGLEKHCDFIAISIFRHIETSKICFAIESTRYTSITNPVSKRISNVVF